MTGAALTLAAPATTDAGGEFGYVLNGVVLGETAASLAGTLEPGFLSEAGWDPLSRVLSMPRSIRCWAAGCAGWTAAPRPPTAPGPADCATGAPPG